MVRPTLFFGPGQRFETIMIITIDGPAGSGKSTAARNLAARLNFDFLDTGATYRAATLKALRELGHLESADEQQLARIAREAKIEMRTQDHNLRVFLEGEDVSEQIRTSAVTQNVYHLAQCPAVREVLVQLQRQIGAEMEDFVTEGRDQGTVVFPQAQKKIYLDARAEVRAGRRLEELQASGEEADYDSVLQAIRARDQRDLNRAVGPLARPADAYVLDTSEMDPEQVIQAMLKIVQEPT